MMVLSQKVCPETKPTDWLKIILFAHTRGYLYMNKDQSAFAMCYRIPEWDEKWTVTMPKEESGRVLYVAFAVSKSEDNKSLLKMLKSYPDIDEVYWHSRNNDENLKHFKIRRNQDGKI